MAANISSSVLSEVPLFRWAIGLFTGVLLAAATEVNPPRLTGAVFLLVVLWLLLWRMHRLKTARQQFACQLPAGYAGWMLLLLCGYLLAGLSSLPFDRRIPPAGQEEQLLLKLEEPPLRKGNKMQAEVRLLAIYRSPTLLAATGNILLQWEFRQEHQPLRYGDHLWVYGRLQSFAPPLNPESFDFARWHWRQGRFARMQAEKLLRLPLSSPNPLKQFTYRLRDHWLQLIRTYVSREEDRAVAGNLLLGYRAQMDREMMNAYAVSGTLHILSVSGLHVGVLYGLLNLLLGRADRYRITRILKWLLLLALLGGYALLTGLSPSVLRSVWMCGLLLTAQTFQQRVKPLNILLASGLILWTANPQLVWDAGFQLSYTAVWGIMYVYPMLQKIGAAWIGPLRKVWEAAAVALAAQIATLPLSLYLFFQFPLWFLPANLIAVPLGNIALVSGMALFATQPIPAVTGMCGKVLSCSLYALNTFVRKVEQWPMACIDGLYVTTAEALLLVVMVVLLVPAISVFRFPQLSVWLLAAICFTGSLQWRKWKRDRQEQLWVLAGSRNPPVLYAAGRQAVLFGNPSEAELWQLRRFLASGGWIWHIRKVEPNATMLLQTGRQRGVMYEGDKRSKETEEQASWLICGGKCIEKKKDKEIAHDMMISPAIQLWR